MSQTWRGSGSCGVRPGPYGLAAASPVWPGAARGWQPPGKPLLTRGRLIGPAGVRGRVPVASVPLGLPLALEAGVAGHVVEKRPEQRVGDRRLLHLEEVSRPGNRFLADEDGYFAEP